MSVIVSRAAWGARYRAGSGAAPLPVSELWLHHSTTRAPAAAASFAVDAAAMRTLEQVGQDRFGVGVSYTFAVTPSGRVFEGHGVGRRGAHTRGRNSVSRAICLVGNYEIIRPTAAQVTAVVDLLRHGRDAGWWRRAQLTGGHRDAPAAQTACPGRFAHPLIAEINRRAKAPQEDDVTPEQAAQLTRIDRTLRFGQAGVRPAGDIAVILSMITQRLDRIEERLDALSADRR